MSKRVDGGPDLANEALGDMPSIKGSLKGALSLLRDAGSESNTVLSHAACLLVGAKEELIAACRKLDVGLVEDRPPAPPTTPATFAHYDSDAIEDIYELQAQLRGAKALIA